MYKFPGDKYWDRGINIRGGVRGKRPFPPVAHTAFGGGLLHKVPKKSRRNAKGSSLCGSLYVLCGTLRNSLSHKRRERYNVYDTKWLQYASYHLHSEDFRSFFPILPQFKYFCISKEYEYEGNDEPPSADPGDQ